MKCCAAINGVMTFHKWRWGHAWVRHPVTLILNALFESSKYIQVQCKLLLLCNINT